MAYDSNTKTITRDYRFEGADDAESGDIISQNQMDKAFDDVVEDINKMAEDFFEDIDAFNAVFLGAATSNPTVDGDGNPVQSGALYVNTAVPELRFYTGSQWVPASQSSVIIDNFIADGTRTVFELGIPPRSEKTLFVHIDGTYQNKDTFSISGNALVFSEAPPDKAKIETMLFSTTSIGQSSAELITNGQGGTVQDFIGRKEGNTKASLSIRADLEDGKVYTVTDGLNGQEELYRYVAGSVLVPNGGTVLSSAMAGNLESLRTVYADWAEFINDPRTFDAGVIVTINKITASYTATDGAGNLGRTNAGDQAFDVFSLTDDFLAFGADSTGVEAANVPFRAMLNALNAKGGGKIAVPVGTFRFAREIDPNQPPATATFGQKAGFVAHDNITIEGVHRDLTIFDIETPGQNAGALDPTLYWMFLAHGDNFSISKIHLRGQVAPEDFEFVSFWGTVNIPGFIVHANMDGDIYGAKSSVTDCRLTGTRGMAYNTSIIDGVVFERNDLSHTNGVNPSGADISCCHNTFYYSELLESAGSPSLGKQTSIRFDYNICRECNGGAIGGNNNADDSAITYGYSFSHNIMMNFEVEATAGFNIANNAHHVEVNGNIITGLFTSCLGITEGALPNSAPNGVVINGGRYETTKSGTSNAIQISISEGEVHINGAYLKTDDQSPLQVQLGASAKLYIGAGTTMVGVYGLGYTSGSTGDVYRSPGSTWIPTSAGNVTDFAANVINTAADCTKISPFVQTTKSAALAASQLVEVFKKAAGTQAVSTRGYFLRYMSGRMGWGDPNQNAQEADVFLERKAANVLGLDAGDCFRCGTFTTAGRPSAAAVGAGSQGFDTTLGKPVWSDGTNWKDASGTTV